MVMDPDWKVCLARPISLPRTLNFSRPGSSREIFVKQQKETIELLFSDTNTAAQEIWMQERSPAHCANFPIWLWTFDFHIFDGIMALGSTGGGGILPICLKSLH